VLSLRRLKMTQNNQKSIEFALFTYINLRDRDIGEKFLSILYDYGQDYAPEKVDYGKKWKPLRSNHFSSLLENWPKVNNVLFKRDRKYESEIAILLGDLPKTPKGLSCWIEESFYRDPSNREQFLETAKLFYDLLHPHYSLIHSAEDMLEMATVQDPRFGKTILPINLEKGFPGIYWANFWGPSYVDKLGRKKLLSAPSYKVEELSDGGLLVLTAPSPLVQSNTELKLRCKELKDYIGKDNFYP